MSSRFATRAVHAGLEPDPAFGDVVPAIHQSRTYVQTEPGQPVGDYDYSRSANPTVARSNARSGRWRAAGAGLHQRDGGRACADHRRGKAGDHVVIPDDLYGGTYRLVHKLLNRWGLRYTMVDQTDLAAVEAAVGEATKLIWVETPTNPTLKVVDIEAIVARKRGALVAVDNTFATPVYQRPLELGADAVRATPPPSTSAGTRTRSAARRSSRRQALHEAVKFVQNSVGAVPGPLDAFLVLRGIRTLHLRMAAHSENARAVSEWLATVDGVSDVRWPGFSGMVSFRHQNATRIAAATEVFSLAESLGGVESLIEVPQAMTHQSVEGSAAAVPEDLVRLSCGIEAAEDLVEDLAQAIGAPVPATA